MPNSDRKLLNGFGFGCFVLVAAPILLFIGWILFLALEPASWQEKSFAEDWVEDCVVSPRPASLHWFKTLDFHVGNIAGDADSCVAAYTITAKDFDKVLAAHKWILLAENSNTEQEFRRVWPDYQGQIEGYYYDDGDAKSDSIGRSTYMTVSADHTKFIFNNADAWARPFENHKE